MPDDLTDRLQWAARAGRIAAYREEWSIPADEIHLPPADAVQHREWEAAGVRALETARRLGEVSIERGLEGGFGIEM